MAAAMARHCTPASLRAHAVFNQGIWRNVLLLAPTDPTLVDTVRVAWNVAADARRLLEAEERALELRRSRSRSRSSRRSPSRRPRELTEGEIAWEQLVPQVSVSVHRVADTQVAAEGMKPKTIFLQPVPPRGELARQRSREVIRQASRELIKQGNRQVSRQRSRRDLVAA